MDKYIIPAMVLSILLATMLPLCSALKAHKETTAYPIVKFDIEPYDPRDLLKGHYMTFRIKWNWKKDIQEPNWANDETCLCIGEGDVNPEVSPIQCSSKKETTAQCQHVIAGQYYHGYVSEEQPPEHSFDAGVDRYYVDERFGIPLEQLFAQGKENFMIGLGMKPFGKPVIESLYIDNLSLQDYVDENGGTVPDPNSLSDQP